MKQEKTNTVYYFNWWARSTGLFSVSWFNSPHHFNGTVFRCFPDSLFYWRITGTTTLPQQQNTANLKDLCEVWNTYFVFADISDHFSGSGWKNIALKRFATKYIHSQSKCPIFHSIQCSLCALCYFVVDTGVDICPNFGLTSCNLTFPTSTPLSGKWRTKQIMTKCSWIREKCDNILFFCQAIPHFHAFHTWD